MLHGNGVDHRLLLALDDLFLRDCGWERIYVDLPGFGESTALPDPGGTPEYAAWVLDFVHQSFGDQPFAVLGNSFGGLLARHVVAQLAEQVIGLALLCPVVDPIHAHRTLPEKFVTTRDDELLNELDPDDRALFEDVSVVQTRAIWERFQQFVLPGLRAADERSMNRLVAHYPLGYVPEEYGSAYERPTLVIAGHNDHIVGYEDQFSLLSNYPHATYTVINGVGHNAHIEAPGIADGLIRNWLWRMQSI